MVIRLLSYVWRSITISIIYYFIMQGISRYMILFYEHYTIVLYRKLIFCTVHFEQKPSKGTVSMKSGRRRRLRKIRIDNIREWT